MRPATAHRAVAEDRGRSLSRAGASPPRLVSPWTGLFHRSRWCPPRPG